MHDGVGCIFLSKNFVKLTAPIKNGKKNIEWKD